MIDFDWKSYIKQWSRKHIEALDEIQKLELPPEVIESGYLGYSGAADDQIASTEARLGVSLPPSYRDFIKTSNGLCSTWKYGIKFYSTEEVDWFAARNQEWIDIWTSDIEETPSIPNEQYFVYGEEQDCINIRSEYMQTALQISSDCDGYIYLLNPLVITPDGEWEAWDFGNKLPGAFRYRSFQ
ncbi:Knr4/Smi1-like domain-containing protein [Nostoc sp. DSM 114160]|jgi:hypothetical protein